MATWPNTLPKPQISGYAISPGDQAVRTDMDVGTQRVRRRTFARNDKISASWVFTDAQMSAFRTWFDDGTTGAAGGSAWFTVTLPIGTGGSSAVEARFTGPFKVGAIGPLLWNVTADIEVR